MAETETGQEKTEPATSRKRERAREEGQVPKSMELNTAVMLIAGVVAFYLYGDLFIGQIAEAIRFYLDQSATRDVSQEGIYNLMWGIGYRILKILTPFFIIFTVVALVINVFQVGFLFVSTPLVPNLGKINPWTGLSRLFAARSRMELVKSIGKMFLIAPLMIWSIYKMLPGMLDLIAEDMKDILVHIAHDALNLSVKALLLLLILALIDYIFQRYQHERDMRMTKQEVKQELKDVQGDPQIRGRIRSIQLEMSRRRMMEKVPEAEVVVTNPTEYAVALKYAAGEMAAPLVIAKGKNLLAQRIKEIAREHNIPIVENKPLAQSLYKMVDVGDSIPPDFYQAVAEVLAYVYRLTKRIPQMA